MTDAPVPTYRYRDGAFGHGERHAAEETPVALTYQRETQAVMLATPSDLEDFAVGFSITEGIAAAAADIVALDIVRVEAGIECRMDLVPDRLDRLTRRRRRMAGPTGCGLCGIDSLHDAIRPPDRVRAAFSCTAADIFAAMDAMAAAQPIGGRTRAVHAATFWGPDVSMTREDVGRHNALDKLAGALARAGVGAGAGIVAMSSRVSVELIQKAAAIGAPVLAAVSAPTTLAIRMADAAGITLIGVARRDGFEIFTHPHRVTDAASAIASPIFAAPAGPIAPAPAMTEDAHAA